MYDFWLFSTEEERKYKSKLYDVIGEEVYDFFDNTALENGYELRDGQLDMACEIVDALKANKHFLVEAGVGIGKSFAYIVPALFFIKRFRRPVIIATSTIALQEQLKDDISKVMKMIGFETEVYIAKGQTHFLCAKRRDEFFSKQKEHADKSEIIFEAIRKGGRERADWNFDIPEDIWDKINVQNYNPRQCREGCQYRNECYYNGLRSVIRDTEGIIVCNQDLLTADLDHRANYKNEIMNTSKGLIVVDEAHNLEGKVRAFLTKRTTRKAVEDFLDRASKARVYHPDFDITISNAKKALGEVYVQLISQIKKQDQESAQKGADEIERYYVHNTKEVCSLSDSLGELYDMIEIEMSRAFEEKKARSLEEMLDELESIRQVFLSFSESEKKEIFWAQKWRDDLNGIALYSCPKNVDKVIRSYLFQSDIPIVLTSATLTSNHSYEYIASSIGFDNEKDSLGEEKPSPFNYDEHAMIFYSTNLPHPTKNHDEFIEKGLELIKKLVDITRGKTLILFTSKTDMRAVYDGLLQFRLPYKLIIQEGNAKQKETLDKFRSNTDSILLGTGSYWEGINIEGEALSQVIIFRLPFPTPDPIIDYKTSQVSDGLMDVLVPEMIIKLKQGIGRLIRSEEDRGIVSIIDSRVGNTETNRYSSIIWDSLPIKHRTNSLETLHEFYDRVCK